MANKVVARKMVRIGKAKVFVVGLAVVLALGIVSVASTTLTGTTDLDGKDPRGPPRLRRRVQGRGDGVSWRFGAGEQWRFGGIRKRQSLSHAWKQRASEQE